ncbi:MAG: hypothetical protein Q9161_005604 [Pseudevernia consocians]
MANNLTVNERTALTEEERFPELFVNTNIDRRMCRRVVPLKVIVVGMPRTGTQSIRVALKQLGFNDTYHMDCLFENPPDIDLWRQAFLAKFKNQGAPFGKEQWDQLLGHCQAVCDLPTSAFIPELIAAYPDAKLILTPREENSWYASCQRTIQAAAMARSIYILSALDTHFLSRFTPLVGLMFGSLFPCPPNLWQTPEGQRIWIEHYRRGHDEARSLVAPHRRLEYSVEQGWGPLCEFLGVEVPVGRAFPMVNDSGSFAVKLGVVKRQAAMRVVRRWSPVLGVLAAAGWGLWWVRRR